MPFGTWEAIKKSHVDIWIVYDYEALEEDDNTDSMEGKRQLGWVFELGTGKSRRVTVSTWERERENGGGEPELPSLLSLLPCFQSSLPSAACATWTTSHDISPGGDEISGSWKESEGKRVFLCSPIFTLSPQPRLCCYSPASHFLKQTCANLFSAIFQLGLSLDLERNTSVKSSFYVNRK